MKFKISFNKDIEIRDRKDLARFLFESIRYHFYRVKKFNANNKSCMLPLGKYGSISFKWKRGTCNY